MYVKINGKSTELTLELILVKNGINLIKKGMI